MRVDHIHQGDALAVLKTMPEQSVNTCVTSPPYWGLRDYGACDCGQGRYELGQGEGTGGDMNYRANRPQTDCPKCGGTGRLSHTNDQIGLEPTPEQYTEHLVEIFRETRRLLRDDGTLWLNLGDSYAAGGTGGYSDKSTLQGFTSENTKGRIMNAVGTHRAPPRGLKPKDLVGIPWRVAFALQADGWYLRSDIIWAKPNPMPELVTDRPTKAHEYLFLLTKNARYHYDADAIKEPSSGLTGGNFSAAGPEVGRLRRDAARERPPDDGNRNRRSVWTVATKPYSEAHFATYPPDLIKPCILAGCPEGGVVLDPFMGAGTTGLVAKELARHYVGIELNPDYIRIAEDRIASIPVSLFATIQKPTQND